MKEKIFKAFKDAILIGGKTSVSDDTINIYVGLIDAEKITDESQIAEAIKPFVPALKAVQANINSVAATSTSTKESELKTKYEKEIEDLKKSKPDTTKQDPPKDVPEWQKAIDALTKNVETLTGSLSAMQGEKLQTTLSRKLVDSIKEKNIPSYFANPAISGRTFKDEAEVDSFVEDLNSQWASAKQELVNNGFKETVPPSGGDSEVKEVDSFVATITAGTEKIVEQNKK
ncbi:hypothetical protein [Dysgonomonas macrotermitis]|uniref:Uncharacterized protein n=1 Tax=Dysgonomonas macrotermitis TaxID=1346286 RepID=A0A1M5IV58_9BACT|nr:hypothetical protein [Dysgonomonas macrotermitis]SHG32045.1 hypothetical protein SAMN05444362_12125 [Dysgonomonas macrotermitis]